MRYLQSQWVMDVILVAADLEEAQFNLVESTMDYTWITRIQTNPFPRTDLRGLIVAITAHHHLSELEHYLDHHLDREY